MKNKLIVIISFVVLLILKEIFVPVEASVIRWVVLVGIFVVIAILELILYRKSKREIKK